MKDQLGMPVIEKNYDGNRLLRYGDPDTDFTLSRKELKKIHKLLKPSIKKTGIAIHTSTAGELK
jgi:hypothetical protein